MGEGGQPLDDETRSYLEELVSTPVGRRWVLKAGLASAVALGVGSRMGTGTAQAAPKKHRRRMERTDLHFAFGNARGVTGMVLVANGKRISLKRHTKQSRAALRRKGGLWAKMDLSQLSHHVSDVELPAERSIHVSVHGRRGRREVVVGQIWRVPRASTIALAKTTHRLKGNYRHVSGSPRRLAALGLKPSDISSPQHVAQLEMIVDSYSTAVAFTSLHPNIATVNKTAASVTSALLKTTPAVTSLGTYIGQMTSHGRSWASMAPAKNADGSATKIVVKGQTHTFSTFEFNTKDPNLPQIATTAVVGPVDRGRRSVRVLGQCRLDRTRQPRRP